MYTSPQPHDISIVIPISQTRKLRPAEVHLQPTTVQTVWSLNLDVSAPPQVWAPDHCTILFPLIDTHTLEN